MPIYTGPAVIQAQPRQPVLPGRTDARDFIARETSANGKLSQRAHILKLLVDAAGREVPLPQILALRISQYGARVLELRRAGFRIVNRTETIAGIRHSWFRLLDSPAVTMPEPSKPAVEWRDRPRVTGLPLFDLGLQR